MADMNKGKSIQQRFWMKVEKTKSCWLWTGVCNSKGYGYMTLRTSGMKTNQFAHRLAYTFCVGEIPAGMQVCHRCDVRNCVNPSHLFLGTNEVNVSDKVSKGRQVKGEAVHTAKLTIFEVRQIRHLLKTVAIREVARRYSMSASTINSIDKGLIWKSVN